MTNEIPVITDVKKSKTAALKDKVRHLKTPAFCVAAAAAAGGAMAYFGTTRALNEHTIDVNFMLNDELDTLSETPTKE